MKKLYRIKDEQGAIWNVHCDKIIVSVTKDARYLSVVSDDEEVASFPNYVVWQFVEDSPGMDDKEPKIPTTEPVSFWETGKIDSPIIEQMAKAAYEDYMSSLIGCCEPSWEELEESHKLRLIQSQYAAIVVLERSKIPNG